MVGIEKEKTSSANKDLLIKMIKVKLGLEKEVREFKWSTITVPHLDSILIENGVCTTGLGIKAVKLEICEDFYKNGVPKRTCGETKFSVPPLSRCVRTRCHQKK